MVLLDRIELSTSPLPRECPTTELQQRREGAFRQSPIQVQEGFLKKMAMAGIGP